MIRTNETGRTLALASMVITGAMACSGDDAEDCSALRQNEWIRSSMQEWYLANDQLADVDPASSSSPSAYLRELVRDVDLSPELPNDNGSDRFSVVIPLAVEQSLLTNTSAGLGLLVEFERVGSERFLRVLDVAGTFAGEAASPASMAGIVRGDAITHIDEIPVATYLDVDRLEGRQFSFGFPEGESFDFTVRKQNDTTTTVTLVSTEFSPTSVPVFKIFSDGPEDVGYILFRQFDLAAVEGLRKAFDTFEERGVTNVILDLRYNLGGFVFVIDFLADLLVGSRLDPGTTLFRSEIWNSDKSDRNGETFFTPPTCPGFLSSDPDFEEFDCQGPVRGMSNLQRLVFITGQNTASASEAIINGMLPHADVGIVGSRTIGKPVGSAPLPGISTGESNFCGLVMRPIMFRLFNSAGESDYFDGFAPDCPMADDATRGLGDAEESATAAALQYAQSGSCPSRLVGGDIADGNKGLLFPDAERSFGYGNSYARLRDSERNR